MILGSGPWKHRENSNGNFVGGLRHFSKESHLFSLLVFEMLNSRIQYRRMFLTLNKGRNHFNLYFQTEMESGKAERKRCLELYFQLMLRM